MDDMPQPACPWLVVQGSEDELVAADDVAAWAAAQPAGPQVLIIDGVDHFFHGSLTRLRKVLEAFFATDHQERTTE
jgi:alpha/beta superfamily hydrolase